MTFVIRSLPDIVMEFMMGEKELWKRAIFAVALISTKVALIGCNKAIRVRSVRKKVR